MSHVAARHNNFGILRLAFAMLVIVSHSPEMIDGNRSRELLTRLFGTMSFGELAVDGFFIISGYLITKSFCETRSIGAYLAKRFLRIVPGYAICFVCCVFVLAPFVGGMAIWSSSQLARSAINLGLLRPPEIRGVFPGLAYPALNGSMWTIAYEFRCYLIVVLVGSLAGLYPNRWLLLAGVGGLLLLNSMAVLEGTSIVGAALVGLPYITLRFSAVFGIGACFYLFRDYIFFSGRWAAWCCPALLVLMFRREMAEAAVCILGGYVIFWYAFKAKVTRLSKAANSTDLSYGVYLYAWPIQNTFIYLNPEINPWQLTAQSIVVAGCLAYLSWKLVEKPCLQLARGRGWPPLEGLETRRR